MEVHIGAMELHGVAERRNCLAQKCNVMAKRSEAQRCYGTAQQGEAQR